MLSSTARNIVRGCGSSLVLLAIGLFASGWPEHIRTHPFWVLGLLIVGVCLLGIGLLPSGLLQHGEPLVANSIGRDNSGNQIFAPNATIHLPSIDQKVEPDPAPVQAAPARVFPSLHARREWLDIVYSASPGYWILGDGREPQTKKALLVWFANPPARKGETGCPARDLVAHLTFRHMEGVTHVPHVYWLDQLGYQIDINTGSELAVLVGYFDFYDNSGFFTHENSYQDSGLNYSFAVPFRELGRKYKISAAKTFLIDVSIVNARSNETLEQKRIEILMPNRLTSMVDIDGTASR